MFKYALILALSLFLLNLYSISSNIIINLTTKSSNYFQFRINFKNFSADIKINNETVYYYFNGAYPTFKSSPGEIEIIIHSKLSYAANLFVSNDFESIKIKTSDVYVTNMESMFEGIYNLKYVDLSEFDISKVTSFQKMFSNCKNLRSVKFGKYITSSATNMNNMFFLCWSLVTLDLLSFDTSKVTDMGYLFGCCYDLTSLNITHFKVTNVKNFQGMFYYCTSLTSLDLSNFKTLETNDTSYMFYGCESLKSLDLNSFITSKVTAMTSMFFGCTSLDNVNLDNFNTSSVVFMDYMFYKCASLTSLDLSSFNTFETKFTSYMFYGCKTLKSLDLNNFITSKVITMSCMFSGCTILNNLKIDNFDTSFVIDMSYMFFDCRFLTSLNISNFKGDSVLTTEEMFSGCYSLISLDFNNFKSTKISNMKKMFFSCFSLKSLNLSNLDTSLTTNMESMFFGCESLIYLNINNFNTTNATYLQNMFTDCCSLTSLNLSNFQIMENTNYQNIFLDISENLIYCVNDDFYEKIKSDMNNKKCAIRDDNCIPNWHNKSMKLIYDNSGPCVEYCNMTENYKYEYENKCYHSCPKGTTSLYNNIKLCEIFDEMKFEELSNNDKQNQVIETTEIITEITNLIITTQIINDVSDINDNNKITENIENNIINNDNTNEKITSENTKICRSNDFFKNICLPKNYNSIIEMIKEDIINGVMNNEIDDIIKEKIDIYKIENNTKYQITSTFNQKNKIYDNISIIDLQQCETKLKDAYGIPQNETLIIFKFDYIKDNTFVPIVGFDVFNSITKEILDLNKCQNIKIDIILPTNINEDELYKHDPNSIYYKDKCSSYPNEKGVDMTLYDRKIAYNHKNLALCLDKCEYINYNNETKKVICQCEPQFNSLLITWDKLINGKKLLHKFIDIKKSINIDIIKCYKKFLNLRELKKNIGSYIILSIILIYIFGLILFLCKGFKLLKEKIEKIINIFKEENKSINLLKTENPPISKRLTPNNGRKIKNNKNKNNNNLNNSSRIKLKLQKNNKSLQLANKKENKKIKIKKNVKRKKKYSDTELNIIDFLIAKNNDKRGYVECYVSLVKTRHPLISSFIPNNDYNSKSIKICLLFFTFALNFFVNSLFFTDDTMHKIVEDEGIFNFLYNLPLTIYSTLISFCFGTLIKKLALSENVLLDIRKEKKLKEVKQIEKIKKKLIIKFALFFIISFIFLACFWFFIGCFCTVFTKTQIYLIKDTLISFAFSFILPFIKYLFACIIRMKSLNKPGQFLYKISQAFQ